jgi:uncharacterized membrane protein YbhN (UPF0104 family)
MKKASELPGLRWLSAHKRPLGALVLLLTFITLAWYIKEHPSIIDSVIHTSPWVLLALFVLYSGMVAVNVGITHMTIKLCRKDLPLKNTIFLSVYSSVINFFGPLQSGPGVRAVYLKSKIGLKIRDYTYTMLFYYLAYGAINASLLFLTTLPWLTVIGIIAGIVFIAIGTRRFNFSDRSRYVLAIYLITVAQVLLTAMIFHIELHATGTQASWKQTFVFSGGANLALFVSLTPGGIGVREAFLLFTQSLHGISPSSIVAAGILDRAFYVVFLVLLLLVSSGFHIKNAILPKKQGEIAGDSL